jgi:hypothetical protein
VALYLYTPLCKSCSLDGLDLYHDFKARGYTECRDSCTKFPDCVGFALDDSDQESCTLSIDRYYSVEVEKEPGNPVTSNKTVRPFDSSRNVSLVSFVVAMGEGL